MILADKIINLRKKAGWSQEELAEKMDISRQSISKWESAKSIPDLNKIIILSKLFDVSTDYLIKDEIEEIDGEEINIDFEIASKKVTLNEATLYIQNKKVTSKLISKGVVLCIYSVVPLLFLLALSQMNYFNLSSNIATAIGLFTLFAMIASGIVYLMRINQYNLDFEKFESSYFELEYGANGIFKDKIKNYKPEYLKKITISIILFMTSCLPLIIVSIMINSGTLSLFMVIVLILMIGLGVYILIPASTHYNTLNLIVREGDYAPHKIKQKKQVEKLVAFYFPLVTAIYLGWSFWTMDWGTTWIVWPVAGIGFVALIGLFGLLKSDDDLL